MSDDKKREQLQNEGNAALFNAVNAALDTAGTAKWIFASAALLSAARFARETPRESIGMVVLRAVKTSLADVEANSERLRASNPAFFDACAKTLNEAKDAGRVVVFPALMLSARRAHDLPKESLEAIARRALEDALTALLS